MSELSQTRTMWDHALWADMKVFQALQTAPHADDAWREFAHILGAQFVWLGRLQGRTPRTAVWPSITPQEAGPLLAEVQQGYRELLDAMDSTTLAAPVNYTNTAGDPFTNTMRDILLHTALHSQYHRGKVNLLLRQAGANPAPVDYIAYVRGAPAARS